MAPIYIGVDPAFRQGGFWACVLDMETKKANYLQFQDLLHWHDWLRSGAAPQSAIVAIENSNEQNTNFDTTGTRTELARKGRNVGANQAVSELAYRSALRKYGRENVFSVSPREKGRKYTREQFSYVVRQDGVDHPGDTNQDQRDAYKLAAIARRKALVSGLFNQKKR